MQRTGTPTCVLRLGVRKFLVVAAFWLSIVACFAGDIVDIKTPILVSRFSQKLKEPLYVTYTLYKGGGDCSRSGMRFKNDVAGIETATLKEYAHSGFDIGHLANAEDFASNCAKERMTFVFYNALPQTPNLNRGVWKRFETRIRKWSQKDHLIIVCGGYSFQKKGSLYVPTRCFKVVQRVSDGRILFCGIFTNSAIATEPKNVTEPQLEKILGYALPMIRPRRP
jgi:endonuclease G, mitochondrial